MNPLARLAAVAVLVAVAVGGALYALGGPNFGVGGTPTPSPVVTPTASIEGTWDAEFTHTEMLAAGLADQAEDDPGNYGHFLLAIGGGSFEIRQLDGPQDVGSGTYTTSLGSVTFSFTGGEQESFTMPYSVTATTLTLGTGGPVAFRVEPWRRVAPAIPAGPTPTPTGG